MRNTIMTLAFLCTALVGHVQADHGALMDEKLTPLDMENRKIKGMKSLTPYSYYTALAHLGKDS